MPKVDLSVIVLSYNTKDITDECLKRLQLSVNILQKKLEKNIEVIVVDNASEDGSVEMLEKKHKWVKLIKSKVNTGFSGGNNLAMKQAKGEYFLLLNSDAFVEKDTLAKALEYFEKNQDCDVLGVQQHFANGKLQPSGGFLPTPLSTILWISGLALIPGSETFAKPYHPKDENFFSKEQQLEWVMGAFMLIKREVFEETKGFDESIFMYGEEVEWCKRIIDRGFKVYFTPDIKITHLDKASSQFLLQKPLLNEIKGIVRFFKVHYQEEYPFIKLVMFTSLLLRWLVFVLKGNRERSMAYFEALQVL